MNRPHTKTRHGTLRLAPVVALMIGIIGGCFETTFEKDESAPCWDDPDKCGTVDVAGLDGGKDTGDNLDAAGDAEAKDAASTKDAATADAGPVDSGGDKDTGAGKDVGVDTGPEDTGAVDTGPEDTGPPKLKLGEACQNDDECAGNVCMKLDDGKFVCSKVCDGECDAGFRCQLAPQTGSDTIHYCLPLPGDLCRSCATDKDCLGGLCLTMEGTGEKLCGLFCDAKAGGSGVCPVGFDCQSFLKGELCVPTNNTCTCKSDKTGSFWPCGVKTPLGTCTGAQTCGDKGWNKCTATLPKKEQCNGLDDDCDGKTDEGYSLTIDGVDVPLGGPCGKGVCAGGTVICATGGKGANCSTDLAFPPKDLCDKLDNDCDGKTDEDCPPKDTDADGTPDTKDCQPYHAEAFPGAKEPCCKLPIKASETEYELKVESFFADCDYNCDKKVKVCSTKDTDGDGHAAPGDCDDKDPTRHPGAVEKCDDGVDQDCNGKDLKCSEAGLDDDKDGYVAALDCDDSDKTVHPGAEELCNFIDDDCDGVTDDGNPSAGCDDPQHTTKLACLSAGKKWLEAGSKCGATEGACEPGSRVCNHVGQAAKVTCVDAKGPEPELCNATDDDCDGKTDEDYPTLLQKCDGDDADQCQNGLNVCAADGIGVTCGLEKKTDLIEACKPGDPPEGNGVDEDCDGITDEICFGQDSDGDKYPKGKDCNDADSSTNPGVKNEPCCDPALKGTADQDAICDKNCDGKVTFCDPQDKDKDGYFGPDDCDETNPDRHHKGIEKCGDGIDQDCSGKDLDCKDIAGSDKDGDGYANSVDCAANDPKRYPGAPELCNHKDDDCDGFTDEENAGAKAGACGSSLGECKPGKEVCVFQKFKSVLLCVPEVAPKAELCNGKDDNCNGKIDEYYTKLGKPCDGPDKDSCKNGTWTCAADGNGLVCNNETVQDVVELCDGVDNDCDGQTDEGHTYFGKPIGAGCTGLGGCGKGTVVCSPELQVAVCSTDAYGTEPKSKPEACDDVDNDCDGLTDEGMTFNGKKIGEQCLGNGACANTVGVVQCPAAVTGTDLSAAICSTMLGGKDYKGTAEKCNGIDDNCDGHVDEGLTVADSDCKQAGICKGAGVKAKCRGGKWLCNYDAVTGYQGDKEVFCDGVDNDCDGKTDDEFGIGAPCDGPDSDKCAFGQASCNADKLSGTCGKETKTDIVEVCDGKDNDCDGLTDEGFDIGKPCDGKDTDLCKLGTWTCTKDTKGKECVNESTTNINDLCDGVDNDCDGKTDEDYPTLGKPCDGPDSDKCKNGKNVCKASGQGVTCGVETKTNIVDICDGKDNDCDGKTDSDAKFNTYKDDNGKTTTIGQDCKGQGGCGKGKTVCQPKAPFKATCSTNPDAFLIFEGKELCDGLDNDCDGKTDNGLAWKGVAKGQPCQGWGICGKGVVECGKDKNVTCSTLGNGSKSEAKKEVCNNLDDDCDGKTDEEIPLAETGCGFKGVCAAVAGKSAVVAKCDGKAKKWSCDYSKVKGYEAKETLCDGLDNDCDGETDEGFFVGQPCDGDDKDQCKTGTWRCSADKSKGVCTNEKMTDIVEACDGKDNDCDGQTDEVFTYGPKKLIPGQACDGMGECGAGKVMCHPKKPIAICSTDPGGPNYVKVAEKCDALDNDCDGKTDNGFKYNGLPVGAPCSGIGECGLGAVECNPKTGNVVCSTNPDGTKSNAIKELCNLKDDDCDGKTDNNVDAKVTTCNTTGVCAKALTTTCTNGKWSCNYSGASYEKVETLCDGLDNDCNGKTDEPFAAKGKACDGPDADKCKNGKLVCSNSAKSLVCGPEKPVSPVELCDGLDNDCNGKTDDPFPELGKDCDGSDSDSCANGTFTCAKSGKSVQCVNEFPADIKELCDGKDNDCDGETDEDFKIGKPCDGPDADKCANGVWVCGNDGKPKCDEKASAAKKEICNNKDDDCDGKTDEGFELKGFACDSSDTDQCATGVYGCDGGALKCLGDFECAVGSQCDKGDGKKVPDKCTCAGKACSYAEGDECKNKTCVCAGKKACGITQVCDPGVGCKNQ